MKRILFCLIIMIVVFGVGTTAKAALINRGTDALGNRLIYDDDLDITWYDFSNADNTWAKQVAWANGLEVDFGGTKIDDWRLPTTVDGPVVSGFDGTTTAGYNITTSEMGHLYYTELGNKGFIAADRTTPPGWGLGNTGEFQNLNVSFYWSGTESADGGNINAWIFNYSIGLQGVVPKGITLSALAVRSGDVAGPEPTTVAIDIKPKRCPNKLRIKKKNKKNGYFKVAILGTQDFEVSMIDITTLNINGVFSVKSKLKDVTAPAAKIENYPCYCEIMPKDTYEDLVLKFNSKDIIETLGLVQDGDIRELTLTGMLLDGTTIEGTDCVLIVDNRRDDNGIHLGNDREDMHKDKGNHKSEGKKKKH